jgi:hypothetical protein
VRRWRIERYPGHLTDEPVFVVSATDDDDPLGIEINDSDVAHYHHAHDMWRLANSRMEEILGRAELEDAQWQVS